MTVVLIVLNQKALLPKPLAAVVSKVLFWPTLPITVGLRLGKWSTEIDDTVVMGGAPFGFAGIPETLYQEYGVSTGLYRLSVNGSFPIGSRYLSDSRRHQHVRRI